MSPKIGVIIIGLVLLIIGGTLVLGCGEKPVSRIPTVTAQATTGLETPTVSEQVTAPTQVAQSEATPSPRVIATPDSGARPTNDRLIISKIGVNAPITHKAVPATSILPDPNSPDDVVLYRFDLHQGLGGFPGNGGNTVLSGHLDSGSASCDNGRKKPPCEAVFWDLRKLGSGDEVQIQLGGATYQYRVTKSETLRVTTKEDYIPFTNALASTPTEEVSLVTCTGEFVRGEYTHRLIVHARRIN